MLTVSVLVIAVVGLLVPVPFTGRLAVAVGDLVHAPLFGGITLIVLWLLERFRPMSGRSDSDVMRRSLLVFISLCAFGSVMELVQQWMGRHAAIHDAVSNAIGVFAAILCYWSFRLARRRPDVRWLPRTLLLTAGFLLSIAWWTPMTILRDVIAVRRNFPLLASFESPVELQRFYFRECKPRLTRRDATEGQFAMEVIYAPAQYPAATLIELCPDWSAMKALEMDVTLDESYSKPGLRFVVKVIDSLHANDHADTFHRIFELRPGEPTHIRIEREDLVKGPQTRDLDLTKIQYVDLLVLEPGETTKLRMDAMRVTY